MLVENRADAAAQRFLEQFQVPRFVARFRLELVAGSPLAESLEHSQGLLALIRRVGVVEQPRHLLARRRDQATDLLHLVGAAGGVSRQRASVGGVGEVARAGLPLGVRNQQLGEIDAGHLR